ncbi:MAG: hemolysin III family protein [Actinobacteria bacterium]|nr:hemolysin III family protein [Actinomycetota bacterium]
MILVTDVAVLELPRLRGRVHQAAFVVSLLGLAWLVVLADGPRAVVAAAVYGLAMVLLYLVSSTYHVFARGPRIRPFMRRLDHSMIFVMIAGTYTPVCLLALHGAWGWGMLIAVWAGALIGITLKVAGLEKYRKVSAPLYIVLGWLAVVVTPQLFDRPDLLALALAGGLFYTVGAILFAAQWPGRVAQWWGYHEWWHTFTIVAGVCFFAMNAWLIASY